MPVWLEGFTNVHRSPRGQPLAISSKVKEIDRLAIGCGTAHNDAAMTFTEIGKRLGVGGCMARKIYNNAMRKLRRNPIAMEVLAAAARNCAEARAKAACNDPDRRTMKRQAQRYQ